MLINKTPPACTPPPSAKSPGQIPLGTTFYARRGPAGTRRLWLRCFGGSGILVVSLGAGSVSLTSANEKFYEYEDVDVEFTVVRK